MASSSLPPPPSFDIHDRNAAEQWKNWRSRWECYAMATELDKKPGEVQVSVLLTVIGVESHKVFPTLQLTEDEKKNVKSVLDSFEQYCMPFKNTAFERYRFNLRGQEPGESFEHYVTALRQLSLKCDFDSITPDQILRDRIMFGIADNTVRDRLLREKDITLARTLEICRASEVSSAQQKEVSKIQDGNIHAVSRGRQPWMNRTNKNEADVQRIPGNARKPAGWIKECRFCGLEHEMKKEACPAWGKTCSKCKKNNHFAVKCSNSRKEMSRLDRKSVNKLSNVNLEDDSDSELQVYTVKRVSSVELREEQTVTLKINPKCGIRFQIDSGADCNVLPVHVYSEATGDRELRKVSPSNSTLFGYGRVGKRSVGQVMIKVYRGNRTCNLSCELVSGKEFHSVLGYEACVFLDLLEIKDNDKINPLDKNKEMQIHVTQRQRKIENKEDLKQQYPQVFSDCDSVGKLDETYKIRVNESVPPVQHAPRRVPAAIRTHLQEELCRLEDLGIISKVTIPTDWVSSLVVVPKKNGQLRICIDPRDLNKAIRREHYPMPTIEDIATRLSGARVFSILDVKQGFWHVQLEEQSSYLTTFNTPFGRYRWLRMPFGISSAPEIFQQRMHQLIEGLQGVEVMADDFVVYGCGATREEAMADHDRKLQEFLCRCNEQNVVLGIDKLQLRLSEVPFLGHVISEEGIKAAPQKIQAIVEMPAPNDLSGLRRLLGMVQYLAKFLPRLSDITKPLRELTKKDVQFVWREAQEESFKALKSAVTTTPVLRYYSVKDEVTVQCDASQSGLGAVLTQEGHPVAFASRALTPAEQRYAQIEKECLAIVFACERFHEYTYGRNTITVQSDHQPLESIFKKRLEDAPSRLQRMLLRLQKYSLQVEYLRGKLMLLADTLSRAYLPGNIEDMKKVNSLETARWKDTLMVSEERVKEIRDHTKADDVLQEVTKVIFNGWPTSRHLVPVAARPYFNIRDELHAEDGIVFRGNRLVVPVTLRKEMMNIAHQGHIGIGGCLRRMREALFWPGMSSDLKALVGQCDTCLTVRDNPCKEPLESHKFDARAWSKVGADLCFMDGRNLLVVIDYYSNYIEVAKHNTITSIAVIKELQNIFARHGVPDTLITDNGPQFVTAEFEVFEKKWAFEHVTSSPRYPQSNGKAENAVKTIKRLFSKCKISGESEYMALLNWRNTPSEGMQTTPAQRLMGRRCKTILPCTSKLLQPSHSTEQETLEMQNKKSTQARYYNKSARTRTPILPGDSVRMRLPGSKVWSPGVCIDEISPRSYRIQVGQTIYRRNRRQLWQTGEELPCTSSTEDEEQCTSSVRESGEGQQCTSDEQSELFPSEERTSEDNDVNSPAPPLRRSTRSRRQPQRYGIDV
ncbi:hypothetical protein Pmani_031249 [Petrolisthes manimaculis]|uniref:RNA-directed DNA polymerase n=1 Tax=Petrolisthes manimaculis TaxID=1843537 RepID=A0AAE1NU28_9EUCA|nr:hypothetical protein Pmani_031249 [Petrolisthes manimaculis]